MSTSDRCSNPMCVCSPCVCTECHCGTARLGDLERQVMDVVWARSSNEPTVREVSEAFPDLAYTTVATMLERLVEKGLLQYRKEGRTRRFSANGSEAAYAAMSMLETLSATDDQRGALVRFAELLPVEEAEALRSAILDRGLD